MKQRHLKKVSAVIVAGGMGKRLGVSIPKAFYPLGNKPLFQHSLEIFDHHPLVQDIVLVIPSSLDKNNILNNEKITVSKPLSIVKGGAERWQSVKNGVTASDNSLNWVLIHDAARPFVTKQIIDSLIEKHTDFDCVITGTPVTDTIRKFRDDICTDTIDRATLIRVGTPQLFLRHSLLKALSYADNMDGPPTDEAVLMEKCGIKIGFSWGDPRNFKITSPHDLEIAEGIIANKK
jgi:2-C-methyl-D-erythritol 4-phosphate cytidylyltransferase